MAAPHYCEEVRTEGINHTCYLLPLPTRRPSPRRTRRSSPKTKRCAPEKVLFVSRIKVCFCFAFFCRVRRCRSTQSQESGVACRDLYLPADINRWGPVLRGPAAGNAGLCRGGGGAGHMGTATIFGISVVCPRPRSAAVAHPIRKRDQQRLKAKGMKDRQKQEKNNEKGWRFELGPVVGMINSQ